MKAEDTKKSSNEHQNQGSKKDGRETRLASALRTNLQKRKKQKRARASCEDPENTSSQHRLMILPHRLVVAIFLK